MKLHIIGPGVVGTATGKGFQRFGHQVVYTDKGEDHAVEADLHFICTPETAVAEVVASLAQAEGQRDEGETSPMEVVIRSSVPLGTTDHLDRQFAGLRFRLFHNPEFLREAVAETDFLHASRAIIGMSHPEWSGWRSHKLGLLYQQMQVRVIYCPAAVSELVKLLTNAYLATQVSFWNAIEGICANAGVNSHQVARLVALDPRVSRYGAYQHGQPYGGRCLPKDLEQLLLLASAVPEAWNFLSAVRYVNQGKGGE